MLAFALEGSILLSVHQCEKSRDYRCPECLESVRLRGGDLCQEHFYHYKSGACRWSQVGLEHRLCQKLLQASFKEPSCQEHSFIAIERIADLYIPSQALVIEVQYSPIQPQEVIQRVLDYQKIGLQVIWVLEKNRFLNHLWDIGDPLNHIPHYFLDMGELLKQKAAITLEDYVGEFSRKFSPQTIWRSRAYDHSRNDLDGELKQLLWQRRQRWKIGFVGDFLCPL